MLVTFPVRAVWQTDRRWLVMGENWLAELLPMQILLKKCVRSMLWSLRGICLFLTQANMAFRIREHANLGVDQVKLSISGESVCSLTQPFPQEYPEKCGETQLTIL